MLVNRHHPLSFTLMLGVGLLSGCAEEPVEEAPQTMFPGEPRVLLSVGGFLDYCVNECCNVPEDGTIDVYVDVENWLLAPHEECGDEPQCGPVLLTPPDLDIDLVYEFAIETVEPVVTLDVLDIVAEKDPTLASWDSEWWIEGHFVPRPELDTPRYLADTLIVLMRDEAARRAYDAFLCHDIPDHFHAYADLAPTTAPGTYELRATLDDVEVTCTFEVAASEAGEAEIQPVLDGSCAPEGLATLSREELVETPDYSGRKGRVSLAPNQPVERLSLEISRDGEILVEGSHEPGGELVAPDDEANCSLVLCQHAPAFGLAL